MLNISHVCVQLFPIFYRKKEGSNIGFHYLKFNIPMSLKSEKTKPC